MKILIIEDEESLAKILKMGLKKEGITADYVLDGELGQKRLELYHNDYDAVILDLMLPKKSGLEVLKNIREENVSVPVLILTAKDSIGDKVALLDAGADDYLVKPFNFSEVLARLRALTRRPDNVLPKELQVGDLILVPSTRKVTRAGKEITLTLKEFRLLEYLMRNPGQAVGREDIFSNIWDFQSNSFSNIVDVYINRLRSKIDKDNNKKLLETVQGIGYKLVV